MGGRGFIRSTAQQLPCKKGECRSHVNWLRGERGKSNNTEDSWRLSAIIELFTLGLLGLAVQIAEKYTRWGLQTEYTVLPLPPDYRRTVPPTTVRGAAKHIKHGLSMSGPLYLCIDDPVTPFRPRMLIINPPDKTNHSDEYHHVADNPEI